MVVCLWPNRSGMFFSSIPAVPKTFCMLQKLSADQSGSNTFFLHIPGDFLLIPKRDRVIPRAAMARASVIAGNAQAASPGGSGSVHGRITVCARMRPLLEKEVALDPTEIQGE